ncbi:MAG: hypothetical protein LBN12_00050 [Clostridiales Family XIII bacterium]|nr:hypothetical protein [Clostridiales Family XIII bacterium]
MKKRTFAFVMIAALCFSACMTGVVFAGESDEATPRVIAIENEVLKTRAELNEDTLKSLKALGIPAWKIGGREIPLRAGGRGDVWALLNLIMAILGAIGAIFVIMHRILVRVRGETVYDYDENAADEYGLAERSAAPERQEAKTKGLFCTVLTALAAALSIVLFLLAEDTQTLMVMTDWFTIPTLILLVLQILFASLAERGLHGESESEFEGI